MRLLAGSHAPTLDGVLDVRGERVSVPDPAGPLVLLVFLRYASCPMCLLHVRDLKQCYAELRAAGVEVVAVFHSPAHRIRRHTERLQLPFRVIPDPERRLYRLYNVDRSWLRLLSSFLLPSFYLAFLRATLLRFWGGAIDGEAARMPADFLIGPDGQVRVAHYGRSIGDHLPLEEVLGAAALKPGPAEQVVHAD